MRPLVDLFRETTGVDVEVRYTDDAALLAALAEEGDRSPADVLWAGTPGALGVAAERSLLTLLPDSLRVLPGGFVPASGLWTPITVRFRVLAYAPSRVDTTALPTSVTPPSRGGRFPGSHRVGSSFLHLPGLRHRHPIPGRRGGREGVARGDEGGRGESVPVGFAPARSPRLWRDRRGADGPRRGAPQEGRPRGGGVPPVRARRPRQPRARERRGRARHLRPQTGRAAVRGLPALARGPGLRRRDGTRRCL